MPAFDETTDQGLESAASIRQLELELAIVLEEAREDLYAADVVRLCIAMEKFWSLRLKARLA